MVVNPLPTLVFDRFALYFKLFPGDRFEQKAHAVGLQPQSGFQLVDRQCFIVIGTVRIGGAIECATRVGNQLEMLFISHVRGTLEHHVFKKMCKTRTPDLFAAGADVVGHINVHQRV